MIFEVEKLVQDIACKYGIIIKEKQEVFLDNIIRERSQHHNFSDVSNYVKWIMEKEDHPELQLMIDELTVNETYFFRNIQQFQYLGNHIIPEIMKNRTEWRWNESGVVLPKIRVLSAGCATGEEPYSIAMSFAENIKYLRSWDIRIDAFDISRHSLKKAKEGRYFPTERMQTSLNNMNPEYIKKYFIYRDNHYIIKDQIMKLVYFKQDNLKAMFEIPGSLLPKYDVIFCRNVMIYFNFQNQNVLVKLLEDLLEPGGFLMMGDAEALHLYDHGLQLVNSSKGLIYQKPASSVLNHK